MPSSEIMSDWKKGKLHSGKGGKIVTSKKQAVAIKMAYERKEGKKSHARKGRKKL